MQNNADIPAPELLRLPSRLPTWIYWVFVQLFVRFLLGEGVVEVNSKAELASFSALNISSPTTATATTTTTSTGVALWSVRLE